MLVHTIENPLAVTEVGTGKGKARAHRTSVHVAADLQLVGHLGDGTVEALLLLVTGSFAVDHILAKDCLDNMLNEAQLLEAIGIKRDVKPKTEETLSPKL